MIKFILIFMQWQKEKSYLLIQELNLQFIATINNTKYPIGLTPMGYLFL